MTHRTFLATGVALVCLAGALPARAADVTPAQKAAVEAQLKAFYGLGGASFQPPTPPSVTAAGDHFDVTAPLRLTGGTKGEIVLTGKARPASDGHMVFSEVRTKVPLTLTTQVTLPPEEGKKGKGETVTVTYVLDAAAQDGTVDFDAGFTRPSLWTSTIRGLAMRSETAGIEQTTLIETMVSKATMTPVADARVDLATDGVATGYTMNMKMGQDQPAVAAKFGSISVNATAKELSRDKAVQLFDIGSRMSKLGQDGKSSSMTDQEGAKLMAELIGVMKGFASEMDLVETFDAVAVNAAGLDVGIEKINVAMSGKSVKGMLTTVVELGAKGLTIPDIGLGPLMELVPGELSLKPYVTNVSVDDLAKVAADYSAKRNPAASMNALFKHGDGLEGGLQSLLLEMGGATFTGDAKVLMTSPTAFTGTGRLAAANFDALVGKLQDQPMAQQIMPAVIFLKGIGKAEGGKLVWTMAYNDGKLLVNNIDLTAMTGGSQPKTQDGAPKRPRR